MSSFNVLGLAVVRAAGELHVVVRLLLFKHRDLPKKHIHDCFRIKQRLSGGQGRQEAVCGRSERCTPTKNK